MAHPGSWFGLPEFGITERIGDLLGLQKDPQSGGSQLYDDVSLTERFTNPFNPYLLSIFQDFKPYYSI